MTPYPGYPPSFTVVKRIGGFDRYCLVIELLSLGELSPIQIAMVKEQLEATLEKLRLSMAVIEKSQVVVPDRFDTLVRQGLRLP